jgi:hypothetical protein
MANAPVFASVCLSSSKGAQGRPSEGLSVLRLVCYAEKRYKQLIFSLRSLLQKSRTLQYV